MRGKLPGSAISAFLRSVYTGPDKFLNGQMFYLCEPFTRNRALLSQIAVLLPVADSGKGPGGPPPTLFLNNASPAYIRVWMTVSLSPSLPPPPPPLSESLVPPLVAIQKLARVPEFRLSKRQICASFGPFKNLYRPM